VLKTDGPMTGNITGSLWIW